ncbi:MAG: Gfo/Idh/MocA family oxidoreductase [Bacillota bacterium]
MKKLRFGIVGIGKQGSYYARVLGSLNKLLVKGGELTAICEIKEDRIAYAKAKYPNVKIFTDYNEMFASGEIDAVCVETPHYQHPTITMAALKAGLHVLCDKPAGVHTTMVKEMIACAEETKKQYPDQVFGMMFNQRTNPLYIKAKEIIDSGELGDLKRIVWIITNWYRPQKYYDQGGWRGTWGGEGGGVLLNQCPHQLDLFTWLVGLPESVSATISTRGRNISVENDVTAVCKYKNGATGVFITSTHDFPGTNRLEITGDGGKIVIEGMKLTFTKNDIMESTYSSNGKEFMGKIPHKTTTYKGMKYYLQPLKYPPQHPGIMKNFTEFILGQTKEFKAPGEQGIIGLTLSNAIHLSGWTGKEVKMPLSEESEKEFIAELDKRIKEEADAGIAIE